jgi:diguanylate cyclase (GGDEF)-like protein
MGLLALDWEPEHTFDLSSEGRLRRRPTPFQVGLGIGLLVMIALLEALIFHSYVGVAGANDAFREATYIATDLADVQREANALRSESALLPASRNFDAVQHQRTQLERQIAVSFPRQDSLIAAELRRFLDAFDATFATVGGRSSAEELRRMSVRADASLKRLETEIVDMYQREEGRVYGGLSTALSTRVRSQQGLIGLGALVIVSGIGLALSLRRSVRKDFIAAQRALAAEFDERRAAEAKLEHWAYHDPLTGLANRTLFRERVDHALTRARRNGTQIAVLFCDLDDFKNVNDSLGHVAGDDLLLEVSDRLRGCLKTTDTAARLGGDEFAVLLEDGCTPVDAARVADRVLDVVRRPVVLQGKEMLVRASVGIALNTGGEETVDDLLRNADLAMYTVKSDGKGRFEMFRPELHAAVLARLELEAELRTAISSDQLEMKFQPIVELEGGDIIGVEALVRWEHPTKGELQPSAFIPIAEETGLIVAMGRQILRKACMQGQQIAAHRLGGAVPFMITVNVSARQLSDPRIIDDVADALTVSGLDPASLVIEITEGLLMQDTDLTIDRLQQLKELGVRLAIDDFGTGYSSLSYIRRFPLDIIKIDKSFVQALDRGPEDTVFMAAVHRLAHTLGLQTIVEGIERPEQLEQLRAIGCEMGQGFLFSRAISSQDIEDRLEAAQGGRYTAATGA